MVEHVRSVRPSNRASVFALLVLFYHFATLNAGRPRIAAGQLDRRSPIAIVHVSVIPMDRDHVLEDQTILVREEQIERVGPAAAVTIPNGALQIDGRGHFLIPGFVDMHTHFIDDSTHPPSLGAQLDRALAASYVAAGVTSAMSLCGIEAQIALRDSIRRGMIVGPRLAVSGPCINSSSMTTAAGDSVVQHDHALGYDFLKVYSFLSRDGFNGVAATARKLRMPIIGHIPLSVGLFGMLDAGAVDIAHLEELTYNPPFHLDYADATANAVRLDTANIPSVVDSLRRSGAFVTTTLVAYSSILQGAEDLDAVLHRPCAQSMPRAVQNFFGWDRAHNDRARRLGAPTPRARLRLGLAFQRRLAKALTDGGVPLLAGTDAPTIAGVGAGCGLHMELQLLVAAGLTPFQALRTATAVPGEFFAREFHWPRSGTITAGGRADLVLLSANPLLDIRNSATVAGVVLDGVWLPSDRLHSLTH